MIKIKIQYEAFNIADEMKEISGSEANGATVSFIGSVRNLKSENLKTLEIEHFPKMAEKVLNKTAQYAYKNWGLSQCTIIHRYGKLKVNSKIVLVSCFSEHRKDSFESCNFIMDYLKKDAPFWKNEFYDKKNEWLINSN